MATPKNRRFRVSFGPILTSSVVPGVIESYWRAVEMSAKDGKSRRLQAVILVFKQGAV
jgi:hypothetical protein